MKNIAGIHQDLQTFIEVITGDIDAPVTFQTFSDKQGSETPAKVHHGAVCSLTKKLLAQNQKGAGIFMMINEGDQQGRKAENVIQVRALFADFDGADYRPATELLTPHLVVETSPGKYHLYWIVNDCPLEEFSPVQKSIASRFGSDPSVHDLSRVMRVPGFLHQKSEPFMVRIIESNTIPPYGNAEVSSALGLDLSSHKNVSRQPSALHNITGSAEWEFIDPSTGEVINLKNWALEYPDFLIADVLLANKPEVIIGAPRDARQHIRCPFHFEHTDRSDDTATFCINGNASDTTGFVIKCLHAHCVGRDRLDYIKQMLTLGWLPLGALTNQRFLAERYRPKWVKSPIDQLNRCPAYNALLPHEKGVFIFFRELCWTMGDGALTDDDWQLSRQLGLSADEWRVLRETYLRSGLLRAEDGKLVHDQSLAIYKESQREYEKASRTGRRGGKSRGRSEPTMLSS